MYSARNVSPHMLVPRCSSCLKIRDENGNWHECDARTAEKALFTHTLCDECFRELYPAEYEVMLAERSAG